MTTTEPTKTEKIWADIILTKEEVENKSTEAAEVKLETEKLEVEKRLYNKDVNKTIEQNNSELSDLLKCVRDGKEYREITCEVVKNYEATQVEWYYNSTLVRTRRMEFDEKQIQIV